MLAGILTLRADRAVVEVAAGGHPGPMVARASGTVEQIEMSGSLLGLLDTLHVDHHELTLQPGDELVLFTDGVTEARREAAFFGAAGVKAALADARRDDRPTATALADAVRRHTGDRVNDDVAILTLRFTADG